jgi:hypothetical protein
MKFEFWAFGVLIDFNYIKTLMKKFFKKLVGYQLLGFIFVRFQLIMIIRSI